MNYRERMDKVERMLRAGGHTRSEVVAACKVSYAKVMDMAEALGIKVARPRLTAAQRETIRQMVKAGKRDDEIGEAVGAHPNSVYRIRKAEGLGTANDAIADIIRQFSANNPHLSMCKVAIALEVNRATVAKALKGAV